MEKSGEVWDGDSLNFVPFYFRASLGGDVSGNLESFKPSGIVRSSVDIY